MDNLFILRGIINHANYLGKELWLTFYDIEKCFDSLWLEDCINSLWDLDVKDDILCLIYLTRLLLLLKHHLETQIHCFFQTLFSRNSSWACTQQLFFK